MGTNDGNTVTVTEPGEGAGQQPGTGVSEAPDGFIPGTDQPGYKVNQQLTDRPAAFNQGGADGTRVFTEEEVNKIRSDASSAIYGRLEDEQRQREELRKELDALKAERQAELDAAAAAQAEAEAAAKAEAEKGMDAKQFTETKLAEFEAKWRESEQKRELAEAALQQEMRLQSLDAYRQQRLADPEVQNAVIPDLHQYVVGNTEEEIEESLARAIAASQGIIAGVQNELQGQRAQALGARPYVPSTDPAAALPGTREFTPEEIKNMDMGTYRKYREQLKRVRP